MDIKKALENLKKRKENSVEAIRTVEQILRQTGELMEDIDIGFNGTHTIGARGTLLKNSHEIRIEDVVRDGYGALCLSYKPDSGLNLALYSEDDRIITIYDRNTDSITYLNFADFLKAYEEFIEWVQNLRTWCLEKNILKELYKALTDSPKEEEGSEKKQEQ